MEEKKRTFIQNLTGIPINQGVQCTIALPIDRRKNEHNNPQKKLPHT